VLYPEPDGAVYPLHPFTAEEVLPPALTDNQLKANQAFWAGMTDTLDKIRKASELDSIDAKYVSQVYSRGLNNWGVQEQRNGKFAEAGKNFNAAFTLNTNNLPAQINAQHNDIYVNARTNTIDINKVLEDKFGGVRSWDIILGENGPFAGGFEFSGGFEDIFGDIFGEFFGGGQGHRRGRGRGRGEDLRYNLTLKFEEAVAGTEKKIKIPRHGPCETCRGNGAKPGTAPQACPTCRGRGQVSFQQGFFSVSRTCNQCQGQGTIIMKMPAGPFASRSASRPISSTARTPSSRSPRLGRHRRRGSIR